MHWRNYSPGDTDLPEICSTRKQNIPHSILDHRWLLRRRRTAPETLPLRFQRAQWAIDHRRGTHSSPFLYASRLVRATGRSLAPLPAGRQVSMTCVMYVFYIFPSCKDFFCVPPEVNGVQGTTTVGSPFIPLTSCRSFSVNSSRRRSIFPCKRLYSARCI